MIVQHRGPGVVPKPYRVKAVDGLPPVGAVLSNAALPSDVRLEVVAVDWTYRFTLFGCRLEAVVTVNQLPTQEELVDDAMWAAR